MINFCTLFDSNYLTRGLALYESLRKVCSSFHLYVVAFDDTCYDYLLNANLPQLTPIALRDFEDDALLAVKPTRSAAEYCWTCTPSVILYCIRRFKLPACTYADADMLFYHDPQILLDEMGSNSVLITEHRYSEAYNQATANGIYCVQFMCFKNTTEGVLVLNWWRERCLEWCYAKLEDGKFGDQKYLDDWTTRFRGVHVLQHPGGGVAPWNVQQYQFNIQGGSILMTNRNSQPVVFFHFHGLKFYSNEKVSYTGSLYELDNLVRELFYFPYVHQLLKLENKLKAEGAGFNSNGAKVPAPSRGTVFIQFAREKLAQIKNGHAPSFRPGFYSFKRHYHFYNLTLFR